MERRSAVLGSVLAGLLSGAGCGVGLNLLLGQRLAAAHLFSVLVYSAAGAAAALLLSLLFLRTAPGRALFVSSSLLFAGFLFFTLAYWGNRWLLVGVDVLSPKSLAWDAVALVGSLLAGAALGWAFGRRVRGRPLRLGRWVVGAALLLLLAPAILLGAMAARGLGRDRPAGAGLSVVLVSMDALRADHLSCYGYPRPTSPVADRLAREGTRFEYAFCPVPSTGPSHATMLTGLLPSSHRLRTNGHSLPESLTTLAEAFAAAGYRTGGFTTNIVLDERFGFAQGFDTYVESGHVEALRPAGWRFLLQTLAAKEMVDRLRARRGGEDQTILAARTWLASNLDAPFFLFLHLLDMHEPYTPPEPYRSMFARETAGLEASPWVIGGRDVGELAEEIALYDGEIAQADAKLGRLLDLLRAGGVLDRVLIVYTSDHGENLGDHEPFFRHADVYDAAVRVPLILRLPGTIPATLAVPHIVENRSIVPTVLSLAGIPAPPGAEGENLLSLLGGGAEPSDRWVVVQSGTVWAIRTDAWKLRLDLRDGTRRLYDLGSDPGETADVGEIHAEVVARLEARLVEEIRRREGTIPAPGEEASPFAGLDREARERLRALGYIQ